MSKCDRSGSLGIKSDRNYRQRLGLGFIFEHLLTSLRLCASA
ncbi:MAG: hypothetical protein QNJ65_15790 [Xenococcaceae cyanobacterium MO_234.B1]|nr:hypothetical protein [Xenococcaceae cyanobacterium MO_234.B1]